SISTVRVHSWTSVILWPSRTVATMAASAGPGVNGAPWRTETCTRYSARRPWHLPPARPLPITPPCSSANSMVTFWSTGQFTNAVSSTRWPLEASVASGSTLARNEATSTGAVRSVVELLPTWPGPFAPQQRTVPSARSAQLWDPPAAIATAFDSPDTAVGVVRRVVVPSPICPALLSPAHCTVPLASSQHVCAPPALTPATFDSP